MNLEKLNTATKYPSILTYHEMVGGKLTEKIGVRFDPEEHVWVTEKIDGTNVRIIIYGDHYIVGSRGELLTWRGDKVYSRDLGIVDAVRPYAERYLAESQRFGSNMVSVVYGELYGGKINRAKSYTGDPAKTDFRIFDAWAEPMGEFDYRLELSSIEELAQQREHGNGWFDFAILVGVAEAMGAKTVPCRSSYLAATIPQDLSATRGWMGFWRDTMAEIDNGGDFLSEGVVIRSHVGRKIAKLRFDDYDKVLRQKK